jgi:hypothetical protein
VVAGFAGFDTTAAWLASVNAEHGISKSLGQGGYFILGTLFFALMCYVLYRVAMKKDKNLSTPDTNQPRM